MGFADVRPFAGCKTKKGPKVLGWQYEMIYLGGDSHNPKQAIVNVRTLERAIVIRAVDGKEETFCSVLIPYANIVGIDLMEIETGHKVAIGEKHSFRDVFDKVLITYCDNHIHCTLELQMSMAANIYQNSKLCKNMQKYVAAKLRRVQ